MFNDLKILILFKSCNFENIQNSFVKNLWALSFIHQSAKLFHCNLTPYAVAVTDKGSWKLSGLEFAKSTEDDNFKFDENQPHIALP